MILFQIKKYLYRKQLKLRLLASPSLRREIYIDALQHQADDRLRAISRREKQLGLCSILYTSMHNRVNIPDSRYVFAYEMWKFLPEFAHYKPKSFVYNADWWWPNSSDSELRFGILTEMIEMIEHK